MVKSKVPIYAREALQESRQTRHSPVDLRKSLPHRGLRRSVFLGRVLIQSPPQPIIYT